MVPCCPHCGALMPEGGVVYHRPDCPHYGDVAPEERGTHWVILLFGLMENLPWVWSVYLFVAACWGWWPWP